ncbi:helix-turn-helix domain-containing protein [Spirillospora sp. CA-294931]|uniref:PucR family transcriptional regulator n=1 Tax=Spirillospora sp. CA-294931 TaxID=3240042 RepID=UPI003D8CAD91
MTRTLEAQDRGPVPSARTLAVIMRAELPSLAEEMAARIGAAIPEYGPDGEPAPRLRLGVERALEHFVDQFADPRAPRRCHDDTYRGFGRHEARAGRTLDTLQSAFRIGAQVAWRRVMEIAPRRDLAPSVMAGLADAVFAYIDELAALALEGYDAARPDAEIDALRQRLLELILTRPATPAAALAEPAARAGWTVPDEVTPVVLPSGIPVSRTALDDDVLADFVGGEPVLLVPGRLDERRLRTLADTVQGGHAVAGPTVPLAEAPDSLRWARRAAALAEEGLLGTGPVIRCEDHLMTLWLMADPVLVDQIARRHLAGVADLGSPHGDRLLDTLRAWLTLRATAATVAAELDVHPQTVRYRMRQLDGVLGGRLTDPESRFGMEVALRARWLRREGGA